MGGASSGRRDGKALVEDCLTIDLAAFTKAGAIREGWCISGKIEWSGAQSLAGSLSYRLDLRDTASGTLTIGAVRPNGEAICQVIRLTSTAQPLGGRRWWMLCPTTGKRARTLHLASGQARFASREALGLAYRVERLAHYDRPFEKLFRAQRRLGSPQGLLAGLHRPAGMWRRKFAAKLDRFAAIDLACTDALLSLPSSGKKGTQISKSALAGGWFRQRALSRPNGLLRDNPNFQT
jgi:hypothetical protein